MRTTTSLLFAALATAAIAHSVKTDYYNQQQHDSDAEDRDGAGWGDVNRHYGGHGSADGPGKGFLSSIKHYAGKAGSAVAPGKDDDKDFHGRPAGHYHSQDWNDDDDDDDEDDSDLMARGLFSSKHKGHNTPPKGAEYYDDEGKLRDDVPTHKHHGLKFPNEEHYDDNGRILGDSLDARAMNDKDDDEDINLSDDDDSRRTRQLWYANERENGHPGHSPQAHHGASAPSKAHNFGPNHHLGHKQMHARSMPVDDDEDDDEEINLPDDDDSRHTRQNWYDNERANGHKGAAPAAHGFQPAHHRHYSKHQMRGIDVDRDAATNSDQYYYDVGDEGDECEYDPSYGSEEYDEGFEKRDA